MEKMKKVLIILFILTIALFSGCAGNNGQGVIEPYEAIEMIEIELSVEHLTGEYAQYLRENGANVILGSIDLREHEDGVVRVYITEKEYIYDPDHPSGYRIIESYADEELIYYLASDAKGTFLLKDEGITQAMAYDEFVDAVWQDFFDTASEPLEYQQDRIYYIYIVEGEIKLLIAREMP